MKKYLLAIPVLLLAFTVAQTKNHLNLSTKLGQSFQKVISENPDGTYKILVYMKEKADLSGAKGYVSKEEKSAFVYATLTSVTESSQRDLREFLDSQKIQYRPYYINNTISIKQASLDLIDAIAARKDVLKIYGNPKIQNVIKPMESLLLEPQEGQGPEGSLVESGATQVWEQFGITGKGIVIAGQDTGIDWDHPALINSYRGKTSKGKVNHNYNWHDSIHEPIAPEKNTCGYNLEEPCDDNAHGTHTIGTVLGDDGVGNQIGMAPGAQWMGCRNMDMGYGTPETYIECFEFFLAPYGYGEDPAKQGRPELAPHVINNSWGCPKSEGCEGDEMVTIMKALKAAGIIVVVSAGNEGPNCSTIESQAATISEYTLSVGAHNHRDGMIARFSSRGPSVYDNLVGPDVTAPGVRIRSSVPGGGYQGGFWSGTSMAGPHVVGQVALLLEADPTLIGDVDRVTEVIRATATPTRSDQSCSGVSGNEIPNNTYGYGRINALKAVQNVLQ